VDVFVQVMWYINVQTLGSDRGIFMILCVLINVAFLKHSKLHYIISVTRVNMFVPDQVSVLRPSTAIILYILFIYSVLCALSLSSYIL
jgi:hypothetical protein